MKENSGRHEATLCLGGRRGAEVSRTFMNGKERQGHALTSL
jgi:hypothetical protein